MDPGGQTFLDERRAILEARLRRAWSLSLGGVVEGLALLAPPLVMLVLVGTLTVTDGMTVIGLGLLFALPLFLVSLARLGSVPAALRKALALTVVNLLAASVGYIIHALPNFFFA